MCAVLKSNRGDVGFFHCTFLLHRSRTSQAINIQGDRVNAKLFWLEVATVGRYAELWTPIVSGYIEYGHGLCACCTCYGRLKNYVGSRLGALWFGAGPGRFRCANKRNHFPQDVNYIKFTVPVFIGMQGVWCRGSDCVEYPAHINTSR